MNLGDLIEVVNHWHVVGRAEINRYEDDKSPVTTYERMGGMFSGPA
jgi:hypothetical protein